MSHLNNTSYSNSGLTSINSGDISWDVISNTMLYYDRNSYTEMNYLHPIKIDDGIIRIESNGVNIEITKDGISINGGEITNNNKNFAFILNKFIEDSYNKSVSEIKKELEKEALNNYFDSLNLSKKRKLKILSMLEEE